MNETSIITIVFKGLFEEDFEIPRNVRCGMWIPIIEEYARSFEDSWEGYIAVYYRGNLLKESDTLKELGIWDGSILEAQWR